MRQVGSEKARIRRLREKYHKRILVVGVILFILGFVLGAFVGSKFNARRAGDPVNTAVNAGPTPIAIERGDSDAIAFEEDDFEEEATPEPTATPQPTPEPTPTPEPKPTTLAIVPFGESYTYTSEVKADGTARMTADSDPYETITFTQCMKSYMLPADFTEKYSKTYKLKGNEAGAEFELTVNDYSGSTTIMPQQTMKFSFQSENGEATELGYQLMDAYVSGNYDVTLPTNTPKLFYKRYQFSNTSAPMKYMVVNTYTDGIENIILFELEGEQPVVTDAPKQYKELKKGDKGDEVVDLQKKLIELGRLSGKADGDFGSKTETAIMELQEAYGMDATGVATNEFLQQIYADEEEDEEESIEDILEDDEE